MTENVSRSDGNVPTVRRHSPVGSSTATQRAGNQEPETEATPPEPLPSLTPPCASDYRDYHNGSS
ncbi:MAG TPA: hypothetical protein VGB97_02690 [Candidatus Paceibacterota bacterium]|jgi:hypothetical protein